MVKLESLMVKEARQAWDYYGQHDVFISCAFEPQEGAEKKFPLYDEIGELVEGLGKRPFLPHKDLSLEWHPRRIYEVPNSIVVPTADVMLCYLGLPSTSGGIMMGMSIKEKLPVIWLYEDQKDFDSLLVGTQTITLGGGQASQPSVMNTRELANEYDAVKVSEGHLEELEQSLRRFYDNN